MRIVEQSRDRLVIEDRKTAPMWQPGFVVVALTVPLLFSGAWKAFVVVGVIWALTAAVYIAIMRFSRVPTIELDAKTNRAKVGNLQYDLSDISHVAGAVSAYAGLSFVLRIPATGRGVARTDFSSAAASTPAERSRTAKIINAFLGVDDDDDGETPRWARSWDAESTENRKCFFCSARQGDSAPLELWAKRNGDIELLYIPRCRLCRRVHEWRGRLMPLVAVFGGVIAGFYLAASIHRSPLTMVIATPIVALLVGFLATWPPLFGSKPRGAWRQIPELELARRERWRLTVRPSTF